MNDIDTIEARLSRVEVELSAMKEKTYHIQDIYKRLDSNLERLTNLMEDRRSDTNDDLKDVYKKISELEDKVTAGLEKIRVDMKAQHEVEREKIDGLNKWRWFVTGAVAITSWFISKLFHN